MLGRALAGAVNIDSEVEEQMLREAMYNLILHEVGHTFALTHNMKATTMASPEQLVDPDYVRQNTGCRARSWSTRRSTLRHWGKPQTQFYDLAPGPYDDWAIEYGYSQALEDPAAEEARLQAIAGALRRARPGLRQRPDDMRSPGSGIDPAGQHLRP